MQTTVVPFFVIPLSNLMFIVRFYTFWLLKHKRFYDTLLSITFSLFIIHIK